VPRQEVEKAVSKIDVLTKFGHQIDSLDDPMIAATVHVYGLAGPGVAEDGLAGKSDGVPRGEICLERPIEVVFDESLAVLRGQPNRGADAASSAQEISTRYCVPGFSCRVSHGSPGRIAGL
jgi:hypothetical protein